MQLFMDVLLLVWQNSHTIQLWCSLSMPQFIIESGLMHKQIPFFSKKKIQQKRSQSCKSLLTSVLTPLSIFDKYFNLAAAGFAICKIAISNTSSPLHHCPLEFPGSSPAVHDLNWGRSSPHHSYSCSDGRPMRFLSLFMFAKHFWKVLAKC